MLDKSELLIIITNLRSFGLLCKKVYYGCLNSNESTRIGKIKRLEEDFNSVMNNIVENNNINISEINYSFYISGIEHISRGITSLAIIMISDMGIMVYDVFGDVLYQIINNELYINNIIYSKKNNYKYFGNGICDAMQLVQYYMGNYEKENLSNNVFKDLLDMKNDYNN